MELKEDAKAIQSFEQALKITPNDPDTNNNYGWFLCQRGDVAKSFSYFMAALKNPLYTTPDRSLVNAGICARKIKDLTNAENYFKQALGVQPAQLQALYNLADIAFERENYNEARAYLLRYLRFDNPSVEALWLAVRNERKLGNRRSETEYAGLLCRRFPDSSECQMIKAGVRR
jgi:type IV pilus assembly protein PilF